MLRQKVDEYEKGEKISDRRSQKPITAINPNKQLINTTNLTKISSNVRSQPSIDHLLPEPTQCSTTAKNGCTPLNI